MNSQLWIICVITSIILIVISIVKCKLHSFLALLFASFYVGGLIGMAPLKMINAIETEIVVHCMVLPHSAVLYVTNALGTDLDTIIVYGLKVGLIASLIAEPLFLNIIENKIPFKTIPEVFFSRKVRTEKKLLSLSSTLFTVLLLIVLMLIKIAAELNIDKTSPFYLTLACIGNPITVMFIAAFVAYYILGIHHKMGMAILLIQTENCISSIVNMLLLIGANGAFNEILKSSALNYSLAEILFHLDMYSVLLAWLVALIFSAIIGFCNSSSDRATAIVCH